MTAQLSPSAEVLAYAGALKRLRQRANGGRGMSQEQAATAIGQRKQSWQAYEQGHRQAILRSDLQDRLTRALGFSRADLEREKEAAAGAASPDGTDGAPQGALPLPPPAQAADSRPAALSIQLRGQARRGLQGGQLYDQAEPERWLDLSSLYGPSCRAMQLIGDNLYPWASSGTTIVYDLDRWPRKDQGCVIETRERGFFVKLFDHVDDAKLYAKRLQPEQIVEFELGEVVGVYAVLDRIDR